MSSRQYRRPYARQRKSNDEGEEEGFLYCLMYYFDEARKQSEEGHDKKSKKTKKLFHEDEHEETEDDKKKKDDEEDELMLNPLVYREHYGRPVRGTMMRRAYTPEREPSNRPSSSSRSRAHSQPPEINHNDITRKFRRRKK